MAGERPYFIEGKVIEVSIAYQLAFIKVANGNVYHILPNTLGIEFNELVKDQIVQMEITSMLTRVLSAKILK